jgi:hypothetical protein
MKYGVQTTEPDMKPLMNADADQCIPFLFISISVD